ncbi:MAG: DNA translocase FtsK 4TM domain-containing protein [Lentisphaeria bacterium]|nr:DNA translocase FtsK 4TM domain-containing protein [Lentisphaeria bacterium]
MGVVLARLLAFAVSLIVLLSLLPGSHDPADWEILSGGIRSDVYPNNWVGALGAFLSHWLLLIFGFAAYPAAVLLFVSSLRRLVWRRGVRPLRWDYWGGIAMTLLGGSMLLGVWPEFCLDWSTRLNIAGLPGGVIGQRLCAPDGGLMRVVLNAVGSVLVATTLLLAGLIVLWVHDWHDIALGAIRACFRWGPQPPGTADRPETNTGPLSPLSERRRQKADKRADRQPELDLPTNEPGRIPEPERQPQPAAPPSPAATSPGSVKRRQQYVLPGIELLRETASEACDDPEEVSRKKAILQETLDSFGIDAEVGNATCGPRVTLYEVIPAAGVKVERISNLSKNISMDMRATSIRILTPIPGRKSVGIEVPNVNPATVSVRSLMESSAWKNSKARIPLLVGRGISGEVIILDLMKAPHLLIAGATGSGKSVCINLMIMSMLYRFTPEDLRLIMVDPKVVEFQCYRHLPHLITPVISKVEQVPLALRWVVREMERRFQVLAKVGVRNLEGFNSRPKARETVLDDNGEPIPAKMPHIVVVIDELADIILSAKGDVETALTRLAQMSRAVGIHAILATQRPSVNVITGTIKANFPVRIAFKVTSQVDSRTILDCKGAEALLGQGDMLFRPPGASGLQRNQGGMVADEEIEAVVQFVAAQGEQEFDEAVLKGADEGTAAAEAGEPLSEEDETLVQEAIQIILRDRRATTSYLQRCMRIGYNRAASIIDTLEQRGVIGPQVGTAPREILLAGGTGGPPADGDEGDEYGEREPFDDDDDDDGGSR